MYANSENFIQVLSHDEVVHGKGSMINKMPGTEKEKFANLRAAYGLMYAHPGKKLLFMGQEFAQEREWSEKRELDWGLLQNENNRKMQSYVRKLNEVYQKNSALYYNDYNDMGFEWIDNTNYEQSVIAFIRRGKSMGEQLLIVCNFTPVERKNFKVGVPCLTTYTELLNSDAIEFGGTGKVHPNPIKAKKIPHNEQPYSIEITLPPLSVIIYKYNYRKSKKRGNKNL